MGAWAGGVRSRSDRTHPSPSCTRRPRVARTGRGRHRDGAVRAAASTLPTARLRAALRGSSLVHRSRPPTRRVGASDGWRRSDAGFRVRRSRGPGGPATSRRLRPRSAARCCGSRMGRWSVPGFVACSSERVRSPWFSPSWGRLEEQDRGLLGERGDGWGRVRRVRPAAQLVASSNRVRRPRWDEAGLNRGLASLASQGGQRDG